MIKFTQSWSNWIPLPSPPSNDVVPYSILSVDCTDGAKLTHIFEYPHPESVELEVTEGAMCRIKYTMPFSSFETSASCGEYVVEGSDCYFESALFTESVPTLSVAGAIILIIACVIIGTKCLK